DSGSRDGSAALARAHGARVLEIAPAQFSHGGTRNLLVRESLGEHVALLTQDAEPADEHWLERLLAGFELGGDVGIVYGPYRPRAGTSPAVRSEPERWFDSLSSDEGPKVERLAEHERGLPVGQLIGRRGFFTDANACLARAAWEGVPFREVAYAEDRVLAIDMLRAGYAKAFVPGAVVLHWREPAAPAHVVRKLRGEIGAARRELATSPGSEDGDQMRVVEQHVGMARSGATLAALTRHHVVRLVGALLGSRAGALPPWARRRLSLERRADFAPLQLDPVPQSTQESHT